MGIKEAFGIRVRLLRDKHGITQEQLAERTGRAVDTVSLIERGINWPSIETIELIATALGASTRDLFDDLDLDGGADEDLYAQARQAMKAMSIAQRELAVEVLQVIARRHG